MVAHHPAFLAYCRHCSQNVKEWSCERLYQAIVSNETIQLIDVREACEWEQGHLPGALWLSKGVIERDIEKHCDVEDVIVLYCGGGFRSVLAAHALGCMGYQSVISMKGGYRSWLDHAYSLEG